MPDRCPLVPPPYNEPVRAYLRGDADRQALERALLDGAGERVEVPVVVGRERIHTGTTSAIRMPHRHAHELGRVHHARPEDAARAVDVGLAAGRTWQALRFEDRAAVFLRAADLLTGPWRARINAACMLGQSKTCHQAEIDAVCELADFFRFNVHFAAGLMREQPLSPPGVWNRLEARPLEGFVLAITPFNFLSIAVNLPTAPALMGNAVLWKPATQTAVAAWHALELLREAGLPDGVIQLLPGAGAGQTQVLLDSPHLAGIHFTGGTDTFRSLWRGVADRLDRYRTFPRLVGETGGKDFIVAHPSARVDALATAILRGGFEYQGQKCSAASRIYVPRSLWGAVRDRLLAELETIRVGDVADFSNFMGAVIDERAFDRIHGYLDLARTTATVLAGGRGDKRVGYFIPPTLVEVTDPRHRLMEEEIFGPVVTTYVYDDGRWDDVLTLVDTTSPYGLTGAVFAEDRAATAAAAARLAQAAGNFYINDKPTGAVVGQQPFGGGRASGTNDKAGSQWNLARWMSPRTIKETFVPPTSYRYPFLG